MSVTQDLFFVVGVKANQKSWKLQRGKKLSTVILSIKEVVKMPYIPDKYKEEMADAINELFMFIESKGDLNYAICELVGKVILETGVSYTNMSEKIDAVHDAETELRRRLLDAYEDIKIFENGDVPSFTKILDEMNGSSNGKS